MSDTTLAGLLRTAVPFRVSLRSGFRGLSAREGVLIFGPSGAGEFAPFADYDIRSDALWLSAAIEAAYGAWPPAWRDRIPVNAIVPAVAARDAAVLAERAARDHGCRTVKVKVAAEGESLDEDVARVAGVRQGLDDVLGPGVGRIRIDANGAWSPTMAVSALRELAGFGLEYVEQPCRTAEQILEVRRAVDVPIAADELIRRDGIVADVGRFADVAVLKVPTLGGVEATLRVAREVGIPVVISGAMDSSVGLACGIAAAAALPSLPFDCGLGTGTLLADDLVADTTVPSRGAVPVARSNPDPAALDRARTRLARHSGADPARAWLDRLARAWRSGPTPGAAALAGSSG